MALQVDQVAVPRDGVQLEQVCLVYVHKELLFLQTEREPEQKKE